MFGKPTGGGSTSWQSSPNQTQPSRLYSFPVSTSIYGKPIPIPYGTCRVSPNLIWTGNWTAKPIGSKLKGGGGKGGAGQQYDYFSDIILGLCHGPIQAVGQLWINNLKFYTSGGGSQATAESYTVPGGGGTYTPTFANQSIIDAGVFVLNSYSVSVNDYGSPGATTLAGTQATPMASVIGQSVGGVNITEPGQYSPGATLTLSFVGGGGSGAAGTVTMATSGGITYAAAVVITSGGSGFTSEPTPIFTLTSGTLVGPQAEGDCDLTIPTLGPGQYYYNPSTGAYVFGAASAGTTVQIGYVWNPLLLNGQKPIDGVGFAVLTGDLGQPPWTYLSGAFPSQAIGYSELALLCSQQLELGSTGVLSNMSFEVFGFGIWGGGIIDAPIAVPQPIASVTLSGGGVSAIVPVPGGPNPFYASPPYVQVVGNGFGAAATPTLNAAGQITGYTITAAGSGYTFATVYVGPALQSARAGIIFDLLTNPSWGAGLYPYEIGDLTDIGSYCIANGLFVSMAIESQEDAASHLKNFLLVANSEAFWSEGVLKFRTYGDTSAVGNGMIFSPNTQPVYDLDVRDFQVKGNGQAGLSLERKTVRDAANKIVVQWKNRNNSYTSEPLDEYNQWAVNQFGLRPASPIELEMVTTQAVAQQVANVRVQRSVYIRNEYEISLPAVYALLEPMDLVTVTYPELELFTEPVRVLSIEEDEGYRLEITVEDFPWGTAKPTLYGKQVSSTFGPGYFADPGIVNPPQFVQLPTQVSQGSQYTLGIALSGSQNWGGATIWVSTDGGNSYQQIGRQNGAATMGVLTSQLPYANDPDTTDTLAVNLLESFGTLDSFTPAEWNNYVPLIAVDEEIMAYQTAALTGAYNYNVTRLHRGIYGTDAGIHPVGAPFTVLNAAIFEWAYSDVYVGQTLYFKFTSFNLAGQREETLSEAEAYPYFVTGPRVPYPWNNSFAPSILGNSDPIYPKGAFSLQNTPTAQADGSQLAGFTIEGYGQVNTFSQITRPPQVTVTNATTGGSIPGGTSLVIGVTSTDANLDQTVMTQVTFTVPTGTNTNALTVTVTFFDPTHDQGGTIFVSQNPDAGWAEVNVIIPPSTTATITSLPTVFKHQPPDPDSVGYLVQATTDVHGGVWGGTIGACTSLGGTCTVQVPGSTWTVNQMAGRLFSLLGSANITNPMPIVNVPIVSNTADTLTLSFDLVGGTQYIFPGDEAEIRTLATTFSATTIGDSAFINGGAGQAGTGLTVNAEAKNMVWIIKGTGAGQQRLIASNTATVLTVTTPFAVVPDATSIFIIIDPNWQFQNPVSSSWGIGVTPAPLGNIKVSKFLTPIVMGLSVNNGNEETYVVQVLTVSADGTTSLPQYSPFREIFQPGKAGSTNSGVTINGVPLVY